jgi:hypothetical protein
MNRESMDIRYQNQGCGFSESACTTEVRILFHPGISRNVTRSAPTFNSCITPHFSA